MIIDVHAHVYAFPKIKPTFGSTTFMAVEDQIAVMDRLGVDKAVILPLNDAENPAEPQSIGEVLYVCEQYPGRFIPYCNIDPRLPRRPDLIATEDFEYLLGQYKALGCKGIGEMTARIRWDDHPMLCMLEAAETLGLPITFHTITEDENCYGVIDDLGLHGLETVLKRFPKQYFFGHSQGFWSEISADVTSETKNRYPDGPVVPGGVLPRLMREHPRLCGDLAAGSGFNALNRDPAHAYRFIDEFQDQLLLGLDFCSVKNDMQHIAWMTAARDGGHISQQAFEKLTWRNANRILNLGLEG